MPASRVRTLGFFGLFLTAVVAVSVVSAQSPGAKPVVERMHKQFDQLGVVENAVVRGDLDDAKTAARDVQDAITMDGLSPDAQKYLGDAKAAAMAATQASDVETAANATGTLHAACGNCHAGLGKALKLTAPAKPAGTPSLATRMREHMYAVELMSLGLQAPAPELWKQGAEAMKSAKVWKIELKDAQLTKEVGEAEAAFRGKADKALAATTPAAKAAAYGDVIASCGHCHSLGGRVFGPGVPK
jgi:cytochrome c556